MRRIGITQRVVSASAYPEQRDCLDQHWCPFLEKMDMQIVPIPNTLTNIEHWLQVMGLDGFILSGGNDLAHITGAKDPAPERDSTELQILRYASDNNIPVLGVCRGMQMLNVFFGGGLVEVEGHVAVRHPVAAYMSERDHSSAPASSLDSLLHQYKLVNSYHNLGITGETLASSLEACLVHDSWCIEAVRHFRLPWVGIMWHPEREQPVNETDGLLCKRLFEGSL